MSKHVFAYAHHDGDAVTVLKLSQHPRACIHENWTTITLSTVYDDRLGSWAHGGTVSLMGILQCSSFCKIYLNPIGGLIRIERGIHCRIPTVMHVLVGRMIDWKVLKGTIGAMVYERPATK